MPQILVDAPSLPPSPMLRLVVAQAVTLECDCKSGALPWCPPLHGILSLATAIVFKWRIDHGAPSVDRTPGVISSPAQAPPRLPRNLTSCLFMSRSSSRLSSGFFSPRETLPNTTLAWKLPARSLRPFPFCADSSILNKSSCGSAFSLPGEASEGWRQSEATEVA